MKRSATTGPASRTTAATKNVHSADDGRELDGERHAGSLNAATDGLRAQKISGHHGARSAAKSASARAAAPRRSSSTLPAAHELARTRSRRGTRCRARCTSSAKSARRRRPLRAPSRDAPAAGVPRAELVASRRARARRPPRTSRADSAAPTSTSRTQRPSPMRSRMRRGVARSKNSGWSTGRSVARDRRRSSRCRAGSARARGGAARRRRSPRRRSSSPFDEPPSQFELDAGRSRSRRARRRCSSSAKRFGPPPPPPLGRVDEDRAVSHQSRVRANIPGVCARDARPRRGGNSLSASSASTRRTLPARLDAAREADVLAAGSSTSPHDDARPVAEAAVDRLLRGPQRRERLAALVDVVELGAHHRAQHAAAAMRRQRRRPR